MKVSTVVGTIAGMAAATAAISIIYPDVSRRMLRDSKKMLKKGKKLMSKMGV